MKVFLFSVLLLNLFSPVLFSQETIQQNEYKVLHRWNLRRKLNQKYQGLFYGEIRGFGSLYNSPLGQSFEGEFYWIEESLKDFSTKPKPIQGQYSIKSKPGDHSIFPVFQNFPILPESLGPNSAWEGTSYFSMALQGQERLWLPIQVEYRFLKYSEQQGQDVIEVQANFGVRFKGQRPSMVSGSYKSVLLLDRKSLSPLFMRTNIDESLTIDSQTLIAQQGFLLTWFLQVPPFDRLKEFERISLDLARIGDPEVTIEQRDTGVVLSLENLQFLPDSQLLVPGQEFRLDKIASILKSIPKRSFLLTGHTAKVGTAESQLKLSWERAERIMNLLIQRGLEPQRFLYQGRGGTEAIADNATEAGRSRNRRVEILILED